jgi:chromosome segregation ATPase
LDATTLGSLLVGLGAVVGAVVAYLGKRGENAITAYGSLTNDLQEERETLKAELVAARVERDALNTRLAEQAALRAADQAEIARLRALIVHLGGEP